jgi:iron complex transport system substrate-binding protein
MGVIGATLLLDTFAPLIYPDVFPEPLTDEQVREIIGQSMEGTTSTTQFPLTLKDGEGVELTFQQPPERVVCLDNACVEEMSFLGVLPAAVGEFYNYNILVDPANFGEAARDVPQIPSDGDGNPDFEVLAEMEPDLVVGWSELRPALEGIAPLYTLYYQTDALETLATDTRMLAKLLGIEQQAEQKIEAAYERLDAYSQLAPRDKSIFITGLGGERPEFFTYDANEFWPCGLIELVAQCAYPTGIDGNLNLEALLNIDPDVIVIEEYDPDNGTVAALVEQFARNEPLWKELTAYKNDTIFVLPRTRARMGTLQSTLSVMDTLMPLVYSDVFPEPLTDEQVREILEP